MKPDCPVKDQPFAKKGTVDDRRGREAEGKAGDKGGQSSNGDGAFLPPAELDPPPAEALVKEAVQLLKSLRPSIKTVSVCAVNKDRGHLRALLDGGATHILRPARSKQEFEQALPIKVELAAVWLHSGKSRRQVPW